MVNEDALIRRLADVLETAPADLSLDTELHSGNWDSMAVIATMAAIDEQFGVTLAAGPLTRAKSIREIRDLIAAAAA